jgi:hypothetical protein
VASKQSSDPEPEDDVRRRFREALEKKKSKPVEAHEGLEGEGKSHGSTSDKTQRMFRRKSGG